MSTLLLVPSELERRALGHRDLVTCGIGLAAAALGAAEALARVRPRYCLLVGIGGTRDPARAPLGTLVVGTAVRNEAVGAGNGGSFLDLAEMGLPDEQVPDLVPLQQALTGTPGVLGTVAAASASPAEAAAWRARHPDVLVEEMEGWAVALACRRAGVPLSIVRAVSNVAGERDKERWDLDGTFAALRAALR